MFYHIFYPLSSDYSFLNVFRYITFRSAWAGITALALSLLIAPYLIRFLQKLEIGEKIRDDGPERHLSKAGTPTMGGLLILFAFIVSTLLWANLSNIYIWVVVFVAVGFGLIGLYDDVLKFRKGDGLRARSKLILQILLSVVVAVFLVYYDPVRDGYASQLFVPFFKDFTPDLGWGYLACIVFFIVGTAHAVNQTDGQDGLANGPHNNAPHTFTGIVYLTGHFKFADYLNIQHIREAGELAVLTSAIIGASLGFLWYNTYPAQIFMGDVGSLSLGGVLGAIACISKQELLLIPVGGIFVIEALSVIIQVGYFKYTGGKRFFKMAPLHHHFEQLGWPEPKVIVRFWIVAAILAIASLSTLKLR
jgi:phospho-N-acetylmuramoyl-pentapeptide-transferase